MKTLLPSVLLFLYCVASLADEGRGPWASYVDRLEAFGKCIPQEKVYIHMDNTCYFLGDTLWFKAYLRSTSPDPSPRRSGTLYCELLTHDGFLAERKLIELKDGEGDGFFALKADSTMFAGFYELRAYTRWQLNWGEYEHRHYYDPYNPFFNKAMRHEFFRDYEKLYSRVFPVYDRPSEEGAYTFDMTLRPLRRVFKTERDSTKASIAFFPEGGRLVEGVPCRVAWEACREDGEWLDGMLTVEGRAYKTANRGRGVFAIVPQRGMQRDVTFVTSNGEKLKGTLPKAEETGVALAVAAREGCWLVSVQVAGQVAKDSLALTIMHEGRLQAFHPLGELPASGEWEIEAGMLPVGVNQVTVFDTQGRLWADRLFFVGATTLGEPAVHVSGQKEAYDPYERIGLEVTSTAKGGRLSISVRDGVRGKQNHDTGNILTEMLLSSEIRGFVPDAGWFFEQDDEEHRLALDLLMMVQGWRRFNWSDMAVRGEWEFTNPMEKTPVLKGSVHNYEGMLLFNQRRNRMERLYPGKDLKRKYTPWNDLLMTAKLRQRMVMDGEKLRRETKVRGYFFQDGAKDAVIGETVTKNGTFQINVPRFSDGCKLLLTASDTTRWSRREKQKGYHRWFAANEKEYPEFYVRLSYPYPHYVKPYTHYQTDDRFYELDAAPREARGEDHEMMELVVKSRQRGLRSYRYARPAVRYDAYDAYNLAVDAGFMDGWYSSPAMLSYALSLYHVHDFFLGGNATSCAALGSLFHFQTDGEDSSSADGRATADGTATVTLIEDSREDSPLLTSRLLFENSASDPSGEQSGYGAPELKVEGSNHSKSYAHYSSLRRLDSIFVYTDYSPRLEGDKRYWGSNLDATVYFKLLDNNGRRTSYRDRYIALPGYASPAEFYSPDNSKQRPAEPKDYRRTLYWNPNLRLDEEGKAHITLYNNSRTTSIAVDAQGQSADGTLLWGR